MNETAKLSTITDKDIAWLWMSLTKAFGYKFLKNFGEKDNGVWLEALKDLTRADLEYGFKRTLQLITPTERKTYEAWPPNVKEFRLYCERRLEDFGLPKAHRAFYEFNNNQRLYRSYWSHPLVKHVGDTVIRRLKKSNTAVLYDCEYTYFFQLYRDECDQWMRGETQFSTTDVPNLKLEQLQ